MSADTDRTTALARITFNATPRAVAALEKIAADGNNRTDAINLSLRVVAAMLPLVHPEGTVHVVAPDGSLHIIHMP